MIGDSDVDDKSKDENKPKGLYLIFIIVSFAVITLTKPAPYRDAVEREVKSGQSILGEQAWNVVNQRTGDIYNNVIVNSGFKKYFIDKVNRRTNDEFPIAKKLSTMTLYFAQLTDNIQILTYQIIHRASYFYEWLWIFIPFIMAQITSGYYHWKIKSFSFGNSTRTRALLVIKIIKIIVTFNLLYFLVPGLWVGVMPYMPVLALCLLGWLIKKQIMNYQKIV